MGKEMNDSSVWVEALLRQFESSRAEPSPRFSSRCQEVALAANAVAHLKVPAGRVGFQPLPFSQYVEHVAYLAGIELDKIRRFVGLARTASLSSLNRDTRATLRLAQEIGVPREFLRVYLKLGCLEEEGIQVSQLAHCRTENTIDDVDLATLEQEIDALAQKARSEVVEQLRHCEQAVERFFSAERI